MQNARDYMAAWILVRKIGFHELKGLIKQKQQKEADAQPPSHSHSCNWSSTFHEIIHLFPIN